MSNGRARRPPRCSIVIPVHNRAALTQQCLNVLLEAPPAASGFEIIVVDDASSDSTQEVLDGYGDRIRVITHATNSGFAATCNDGAAVAAGEFVIFLNNDTIPTTGWLDALIGYADVHPEAGAVGSKLLFPDGTVQHAGVVICQDRFPRHLYGGFPGDHPAVNKSRRLQVVTGACMLVRRVVFEELGGFDTAFTNSYEDADFCLRLGEGGYEVHYCHESVLYHLESASRAGRSSEEAHNVRLYFDRWAESVQPDDFDYYAEDGLLKLEYRPLYPVSLVASPELAIVDGPERQPQADKLLGERARQVHDLMKETISLNIKLSEQSGHDAAGSGNGAAAQEPVAPPPEQLPFGVNIAGYFASEKGIGEAARARVRALQAAGIPHVLNEFVDEAGSDNLDATYSEFSADNPFGVNLVHVNAEQVPGFVEQKGESYFEGRYNIGCWFWELSTFPAAWASAFDYFDELWVGSTFVLDALARFTPIPIVRIPMSLPARSPGNDWDRSAFGLPDDRFLFLFNFDFRSILERKNPLGVIEAFKRAFPRRRFGREERTGLVLKCNHSAFAEDQFQAMKEQCEGYPIFIVDRTVGREEMDGLISLSDSYVSLHRSEGFGLGPAEAMSMGKPVIATGYSGNMDFTTTANSFLVDYELVQLQEDHGPYQKGGVWAEPDLDHAARLMRRVYKRPDLAAAAGERGRRDVLRRFNPRVEGELVRERLLQLASFGRIRGPEPSEATESEADREKARLYRELVSQVVDVAKGILPTDATVLVVSRGDDQLLALGRTAWHFPRAEDGVYAGYHFADSGAAIEHLEALRQQGAGFLLLPRTAYWWLDYFREFQEHLDARYRRVWASDSCLIYELAPLPGLRTSLRRLLGDRVASVSPSRY